MIQVEPFDVFLLDRCEQQPRTASLMIQVKSLDSGLSHRMYRMYGDGVDHRIPVDMPLGGCVAVYVTASVHRSMRAYLEIFYRRYRQRIREDTGSRGLRVV